MKIIAKNHNFAHIVEQERDTKSIVVKASSQISFQSESAAIVTPLDEKNLQQVCEYYRYANYRVTIAVDSRNYRKETIIILKDNFHGLRFQVFDVSKQESFPNPKTAVLEYLCEAFEATRSGVFAQLAAKVAIRKIPFIFSSADDCAVAHIRDESLHAPFIRHLNRRIQLVQQAVEDDFKITLADNYQQIGSLKDFNPSELTATTAMIAATGVGKTSHVYAPTAIEASEGNEVVYISHLISLVEQFCLRTSSVSYQQQELKTFTQANSLGSVINSVWKPHIFEKICSAKTLLIDEFEKVYKTLVCSENSKTMQADRVFEALVQILKTVPKVIVADADLTDNSLALLKEIRGDLSVIECTENPYKSFTANVLSKKELINIDKVRTVLDRDKVFLFDNLKTLKRTVAQLGYQNSQGLDCEMKALDDGVLVLHSDNRGMPAQKAFLADPNKELTKYKAVMASPCLGAGFSITENYTNTVNVVCESTLIPRELVNFSRRFRCAKTYNFWCDDLQSSCRANQYYSSDLGQRYDESLRFKKQKQELNEHLALSMYFTLKKLGFEVICKRTHLHHKSNCREKTNFDAEFKARQQAAIVNAVDISSDDFAVKQRSNTLSSIDIAEVKKFDIKTVYKLEEINEGHVRFDDNFDRELFAHFPFVLDKIALVKLGIYSKQKEHIAKLLYRHLFHGYGFEEDKSKCFLYKSSVVEILEGMYDDTFDIYFPSHIRYSKNGGVGQTYNATSYIKSILRRCGFELGRYGGNNQKARLSMSPFARKYKHWLVDCSTSSSRHTTTEHIHGINGLEIDLH
ncbi:hypothetical protein [Vibrio splendidus]|uniref:hypothetical protein n=1 Tax=Vibrio splendidus TaxID=29497 RepID=UPI000C825C1D|nr:hypothetical protein [Vibrio splendidus]PMI54241.1 hypothetical protein BCU42_18530 [Vibrio splendidus]